MILSQICSKRKLPRNNLNSQCTVSYSKQPIQETIVNTPVFFKLKYSSVKTRFG